MRLQEGFIILSICRTYVLNHFSATMATARGEGISVKLTRATTVFVRRANSCVLYKKILMIKIASRNFSLKNRRIIRDMQLQ